MKFESMKLGCIHTPAERLLKVPYILDYVAAGALRPLIADTCNYSQAFKSQLAKNGYLGNDTYGDCVCVALFANGPGTQAANATGKLLSFTTDQILDYYTAITGFKKSDPNTDNGTDPVDALNYAMSKGLIVAWGQVNIQNDAHVAMAIDLFGGVQYATDVPQNWLSSTTWDTSSSPIIGGHMVVLADYDSSANCGTETWAELVTLTVSGRKKHGRAGYAVITQQWLDANGHTLQGFDIDGLRVQLSGVQ